MLKNTSYYLLLLFSFVILGCQSNKDLALSFVERYNTVQAPQIISSLQQSGEKSLNRTYAELMPSENQDSLSVKILFVFDTEPSDEEKNDYENFIPNTLAVDLSHDKEASKLLEKGAKFIVAYAFPNHSQLSKTVLDQAKIAALTTEKAGQNLEVGTGNKNKNISPEVREFLISLNHNLPTVVNQELEIKMLKIDVNSLNDLVYTIGVGELMAEKLKDPKVLNEMEKEIIADPETLNFLGQLKGLKLANIKYVYVNKKGERLADIVISPEDFRKN